MTEKTSQPGIEREFVPGLGKQFLMPLYDVVHHVFGVHPVHREMVALAGLRDGQRVLDVGCCTGNLLRTTGKLHPEVELVGLDPDAVSLARAGRKARRAGVTMRLDRGFAQELPYPDDSFDHVFSSLMLHHLDDASKDALLAEVRRVLRPDGVLVLADVLVGENFGHDHSRMRRRLGEPVRDNVNGAVAALITHAGFTVEPTRTMGLRIGGRVGIEVARPTA
jgi:ubiquinone/menaquinone biosynthesis C-methylase UbiE